MKQSKHSDVYITEDVLDKKLNEKLKDLPRLDDLHQIAKDLSDLQESKWEDNNIRWNENDRRWEENDRRWEENDRRWDENDRRWEENDKKLDRILNILDGVSKNIQDMREESAATTLLFERSDERLDDHEKRLTKLENAKN